MSDGKLLRNQGDGWKLWRSVKPGVTPEERAKARQDRINTARIDAPCFTEFKELLHREVSLKNRALVVEIISTMPQDADGCYSELTDHGFWEGDLDGMVDLCRAYEAWQRERAEKKNAELVLA